MTIAIRKGFDISKGTLLVAVFAVAAFYIADLPAVSAIRISPLIVGIGLGIVFANTIRNIIPQSMDSGIVFSAKQVLRLAIILYGFRITFQEIAAVGTEGLLVSIIMVATTFLIGMYVGTKLLGLDAETAMLTASGSAVCGAAAVLATESVVKPAEGHKSAVAVSTVVLFGTIAMFLYPFLYTLDFLGLDAGAFGIYVGGTVHEVAQVIAVGGAVGEEAAANSALIVKMTRVMLIAPFLLVIGVWLSRRSKGDGQNQLKLVIPWFALGFVLMAGVNSLHIVPQVVVDNIILLDTFLLTMAMAALGMETRISKLKDLGLAPLYLALALFVWLLIGGFAVTKAIVA
jgi:uncharacterized integral membrane protein (TIGR00698 family)